jgi:hypothetical protein
MATREDGTKKKEKEKDDNFKTTINRFEEGHFDHISNWYDRIPKHTFNTHFLELTETQAMGILKFRGE